MKDLKYFKTIDLDEVNDNKCVNERNYIGFAHFYFSKCHRESNSNNEIDKELFSKLVKLDKRLGTRASDQLNECLRTDDIEYFKAIDLDEVKENACVKKENYIGFAHFYVSRCNQESKSNNEIVKEVYTKLVELDTRLGTPPSEQLFHCILYTDMNLDIIKV